MTTYTVTCKEPLFLIPEDFVPEGVDLLDYATIYHFVLNDNGSATRTIIYKHLSQVSAFEALEVVSELDCLLIYSNITWDPVNGLTTSISRNNMYAAPDPAEEIWDYSKETLDRFGLLSDSDLDDFYNGVNTILCVPSNGVYTITKT
jgi:hypothetical protein